MADKFADNNSELYNKAFQLLGNEKLDAAFACGELIGLWKKYRDKDKKFNQYTLSGIYVLGIECDGAAYHSARTARERDRLRQDVLENMGWKIYRIWSTDWIKDPITEGAKLIEVVEKSIADYDTDENYGCHK